MLSFYKYLHAEKYDESFNKNYYKYVCIYSLIF